MGGLRQLPHRPARPGLSRSRRPGTRTSRPPARTAVRPRSTARPRVIPLTPVPRQPGQRRLPARRDARLPRSARHRRLPQRPVRQPPPRPGDFPSDPRGPRYGADAAEAGYHDEDDHGGYRDAGYPDVPATGDYRTVQSGSHRRPAGGYPGDPSSTPIPARRAMRIIPAKRPPTTRGLIRPGRIMARATSGMTPPTTPWRATTVSPRNPSPMGLPPAIATPGNGDAIPAVIDG